MMKIKALAIFISFIVVFTFAKIVVAQETEKGETSEQDIEKALKETTDFEQCITKAKKLFPRMHEVRLKNICQRLTKKKVVFGQAVRECIQDLLKKKPNLLRSEAAKKCILEKKVSGNFINAYKLGLQERIEKCESEECREKFQKRLERIENLTQKARERLAKIEERRLQKLKELKKLELKSKIKVLKNFRAREIAKSRLEMARKRYIEARNRFFEANEKFKMSRAEFIAKLKLKKACKDNQSEECKKVREEIFDVSKRHLLKITEVFIHHLAKIKGHIETNEYLTDDEVQEALEKVEKNLQELEEIKQKIENATNKEELREVLLELMNKWKRIKIASEIRAGISVNQRIGGIIIKSKYLEIKLEKILSRMEERGLDTTTISSLTDKFHIHIENARENYEKAVDKFKIARENVSKEALEEAKEFMTKAREELKNADKTLKEIFHTLNVQAKEILQDKTIDEEIEEEISAEETEETTEETEVGEEGEQ